MQEEHILLLGASGGSGIAFIEAFLAMPQTSAAAAVTTTPALLTVFVRPGSEHKLPAACQKHGSRIRIVAGSLHDAAAVRAALVPSSSSSSTSSDIPPVTMVVSFLGAYLSGK